MSVVKLNRVPDKVHTVDELLGATRQMEIQTVLVIVEDLNGDITTLTLDGATTERINWMLDRAKLLLHRAD